MNLLTEKEIEMVREVIVEVLAVNPDQIAPDARLEDFGEDSLDKVEIVLGLEEKFGITLEDETVEPVETVGDLFDVVSAALGRRGAAN